MAGNVTATLLGHLARFATFTTQGEVLCTQGLVYLLNEYPDASRAFARDLSSRSGVDVSGALTWFAERVHEIDDRGRPDLEGCSGDLPRVKIEAKLDAAFGDGQLESYRADLVRRLPSDGAGVLVVLVPSSRVVAAASEVQRTFGVFGDDPWALVAPGIATVAVTVMSWDSAFAALERPDSDQLSAELRQFVGMYRELSSTYIAPLAGTEDLLRWRARERDFAKLVDRVTRVLTIGRRLNPLYPEPPDAAPAGVDPVHHLLRYVCEPPDAVPYGSRAACFSIGMRDPFEGAVTPIWLRFHRLTPRFAAIRRHLERSPWASRLVTSGGHAWFPLEVPFEADSDAMVDALVAQAEAIRRIAFGNPG